jgi:excinuclease ABC subunit C
VFDTKLSSDSKAAGRLNTDKGGNYFAFCVGGAVTVNGADLLIIDGGKGQLSHAMEVIDQLGLRGKFVVIGLAKRLEEVFLPGTAVPLFLAKTSSSLRLLQQARDEAHRFAISYHRKLRDKRTINTELLDIPGVGKTTATKLLRSFGSVEAIRQAPFEQVAALVGNSLADKMCSYFATQLRNENAQP